MLIEIVLTVSQTIYYFLVANYANPAALLKGPPAFYVSTALSKSTFEC